MIRAMCSPFAYILCSSLVLYLQHCQYLVLVVSNERMSNELKRIRNKVTMDNQELSSKFRGVAEGSHEHFVRVASGPFGV